MLGGSVHVPNEKCTSICNLLFHPNASCLFYSQTVERWVPKGGLGGVWRGKMVIDTRRWYYFCGLCLDRPYSSRRSSHVVQHVMGVHTGVRPFKCDVCSKAFALKHKLNEHSWIHRRDLLARGNF
jgi:hypothetical protein